MLSRVKYNLDSMSFNNYSVKDLQNYLKSRGVSFSGKTKPELLELCQLANTVGIDIDPDGLIEDRTEILKEKLSIGNNEYLVNPFELKLRPSQK